MVSFPGGGSHHSGGHPSQIGAMHRERHQGPAAPTELETFLESVLEGHHPFRQVVALRPRESVRAGLQTFPIENETDTLLYREVWIVSGCTCAFCAHMHRVCVDACVHVSNVLLLAFTSLNIQWLS